MLFSILITVLIVSSQRQQTRDSRKRLGRLHRFVKKHAVPVQYSDYATRQSSFQISRLASELIEYIKPQEDDVRIYQIPDRPLILTLGKSSLPDCGVMIGNGTDSLAQVVRLSTAHSVES